MNEPGSCGQGQKRRKSAELFLSAKRESSIREKYIAKEYLFDKLGVTRREWQTVRYDVVLCSGDLHLRPGDMAKFGQLFLRPLGSDHPDVARSRYALANLLRAKGDADRAAAWRNRAR